jgi:hypothetical protein
MAVNVAAVFNRHAQHLKNTHLAVKNRRHDAITAATIFIKCSRTAVIRD